MKVVTIALAVVFGLGLGAPTRPHDPISAYDWPTYGQDAQHTFAGRTTLTASMASTLAPAWFFPTGLAVTATPTVVRGSVYVGSWDGNFYALDLHSGALLWKFRLDVQPAVSPSPTGPPDSGSDGGIVTSSAWFEPGNAQHPDLVLFGGGFTLYALDARNGALVWKHVFTGRPDQPADPAHDEARIFSSPVVADGKVLFGVSTDGQRGHRGYIAAADLVTGAPVWTLDTDVDATGQVLNDGCGNVWSSGTLMTREHLVVFDTADCHFSDPGPFDERVIALRVENGSVAWTFRPPRHDELCDFDFGATVNAGTNPGGVTKFLGVGGKDGNYYSLDPSTGALRWQTNVVFGGFAGGFIATTAFDGSRIFGSTALGDFGRFESNGPVVCDPNNPADTPTQEPTVHAFDARTGAIAYEDSSGASFAPTTVAGGMTFNCPALRSNVDVRDATNGATVKRLALSAPCWSGIATVGDALVFGTGASFSAAGSGVAVFTPNGAAPSAPSR